MLLRPDRGDVRVIGLYLGRVLDGLAILMAVPAGIAVVLGEWNAATALVAGAGIALTIGQVAQWRLATSASLDAGHAAVVVALAWLVGPLVAAVPFLLSGHSADLIDAWFEAMSGLTTTGLTVIEDLDHLSYSLQLYRHLMHFAGGQGIVIVVLALFAGGGGISALYRSEGRDQRVVPNIRRTAKLIFGVATTYLVVGTTALTLALFHAGVRGWRTVWHAIAIFCAAFDTGGFSTSSQSIAAYHSAVVEGVVAVLMIAGAVSFALHYQLWLGHPRSLLRDLEVRTLGVTLALTGALALLGLAVAGTYGDATSLVRKGFFTVLSAHMNVGFTVVSGTTLMRDWGAVAPLAIVVVMAIGGMAGSTAGGIKGLRLGLVVKGVVHDVRRALAPSAALVVTTYHSGRRTVLRTEVLRPATIVLLLYLVTYLGGAVVGLLYGEWTLAETLFESTSAASNAGLSIGITSPTMPVGLQLTYMAQMWLGRLEFVAALALVGFGVSVVRGRA